MIVKLSNFGGDFTNLPTLQTKFGVKNLAVLLLKFPQLCINVKGAAKVCLPLLVTILGQVSEKNSYTLAPYPLNTYYSVMVYMDVLGNGNTT